MPKEPDLGGQSRPPVSLANQRAEDASSPVSLSMLTVLRFWFPLAASWMLMNTETPIITAVIARMDDAKLHLAAFGVAFSLVLVVESPITAMVTVGNALARDRDALRLTRRFMLVLSSLLTVVLLLLVFTPLFDWVTLRLVGVPEAVAVRVRPMMMAMSLWPILIAYRRYHQGIMIHRGYTRQMSYGTVIRIATTLTVSIAGQMLWGQLGGATVGGIALTCSVIAEATYIHFASRPAVRQVQRVSAEGGFPLTLSGLWQFYSPLALNFMIMLSTRPLLSFGMVRAPYPVASLAVWPVVSGQLSILRSFGYSTQQVVVALSRGPAAMATLRRFTVMLGIVSTCLALAVAFTPLGVAWQRGITRLSTELIGFAIPALQYAVSIPVLAVALGWLRGMIVARKATGAVAWATVINLAVLMAILLAGARLGWLPGASLVALALTVSQVVECVWLWRAAYLQPSHASVLEGVQV
jgi:hypothetical protein